MKKCLVYLDLETKDIILGINENNNINYYVGIESLSDLCKDLNNSEKVEIENHQFLFSFEFTCEKKEDENTIEEPRIKTVEINKNLKKISEVKEVISIIEKKRSELLSDPSANKNDLSILNLLIEIFLILLIFINIQNNEVVPPSEYSKIDLESEAFKSLDSETQTTITDYINEQSDKIVNGVLELEEEKLKQEQEKSFDSSLKV